MRRIALAGLALALAAGCTPPAPQAPRPREIVFWETWPAGAIQPIVARFEAANPGLHVNVKVLPAAGARDSIAAAVAARSTPDLCQFASEDLPGYLASGALSDWSAGVADLRDSLLGWPTCMVGDAIYGLPWSLRTNALFYDATLLARAGLDPARVPGTWQELETAALRVQRIGHGVHGCGLPSGAGEGLFETFMPFAWGDSADVLSSAGDSTRLDCAGGVQALEFLVKLRRAALRAGSARLADEFAAGRLGFLVADGALLARFRAGPSDARVRIAPVPMPTAGFGDHASLASAQVLASFTSSRHKEDALRLARFLLREENVLALVAAAPGELPANRGADSSAWCRTRPAERTLVHQLETARYAPVRRDWAAFKAAIEAELALALDGRKSPARAIADADSALAELVARRGR